MKFSGFFGQKHIIDGFMSTIKNGSMSHAYIFDGPKGIGKRTLSKILTKGLLCSSEGEKPCNNCNACSLVDSNNHPDFKIISSDSSISIESIREVTKDVGLRPYYGGKKVYIFQEAERMSTQAQNSLLKTLEEPPDYVVIILTTTNLHLLLPTIVSRCIANKFIRNNNEEIEQYIRDKYPEYCNNIKIIVSLADGIIGNAEDFVKSKDFNETRQTVFEILKILLLGSKMQTMEIIKSFSISKEKIDLILELMLLWFRDMLLLKETNNKTLIVNADLISELLEIVSAMGYKEIILCIDWIIEAKNNLQSNSNFELTIETMLLKINGCRGL